MRIKGAMSAKTLPMTFSTKMKGITMIMTILHPNKKRGKTPSMTVQDLIFFQW
jgi:hypothetical protein